jgi:lipopolysaccharide transport system permease protein
MKRLWELARGFEADGARASRVSVITSDGRYLPDFAELWRHGHLVSLFVRRNIKLRFKQTYFGLAWVILQPIGATGVFSLFFGALAKIPTGAVPYPVFVMCGLVAWQFFSRAVNEGTISLVAMSGVLSKVYLPRLIVPISAVLTAAVDFLIVLAVVLPFLALTEHLPARAILALPGSALLLTAAALGVSLWTSACDVLFRDTRVMVGFVLTFGLFFTPIIYPIDLVPGAWRTFYLLNPLVPVIEAFRWSLIATAAAPPAWSVALAGGIISTVLFGGLIVFTRVERLMMDRI